MQKIESLRSIADYAILSTGMKSAQQLPIADRNSELEELSLRAFRAVLPVDEFLFREEPKSDFGVDGSLEIKIHRQPMNFRSNVQIKSTDSDSTNADGSISVQVSTSSFNYLVNGPVPFYVLFVAPRNELRFAWAHDERLRLNASKPGWGDQETITIKFARVLDGDAIAEIRTRIVSESQLHARIQEVAVAASNVANAVVGIDLESFTVTDSATAKEILLSNGRLLISSGFLEEFKYLTKLIDSEADNNPAILLSKGYADYMVGEYQSCFALCSKALSQKDRLSADDVQFLNFLRKNCEWLLGMASMNELARFLDETAESATGAFATSLRLNSFRYAMLTADDMYERSNHLPALNDLVSETLSNADISAALKLYAKSVWIEMEGIDIALGLQRDVGGDHIRVQQGSRSQLREITDHYEDRHLKLIANQSKALEEAKALGHRPLLASLKSTEAMISFQFLSTTYSTNLILDNKVDLAEIEAKIVAKGIVLTNEAIELFRELGDKNGELRARSMQANFYEFSDQPELARSISEEILPVAEALGFKKLVEAAKDHIQGNGPKATAIHSVRPKTELEKALRRAETPDDELEKYAVQFTKIMDLPAERVEVVKRANQVGRIEAIEHLNWCRHIEVLEELAHRESPETHYARDPNLVVRCSKYGFESKFRNPDPHIIIAAFKKGFCSACRERSPLLEPGDNDLRT